MFMFMFLFFVFVFFAFFFFFASFIFASFLANRISIFLALIYKVCPITVTVTFKGNFCPMIGIIRLFPKISGQFLIIGTIFGYRLDEFVAFLERPDQFPTFCCWSFCCYLLLLLNWLLLFLLLLFVSFFVILLRFSSNVVL